MEKHFFQVVNTSIFYVAAGIVALAALPLGGNRSWAIAGLGLISLPLLVLTLACVALDSRILRLALNRLKQTKLPLVGLLGVCLIQGVQFWRGFSEDSALLQWGTVDPFQTQQLFVLSLIFLSFFLILLITAPEKSGIKTLLWFIFLAGVFQAFLAISLWSFRIKYSLMEYVVQHGDRAIGSFASPNNLAAYLYMSAAAGIALLLYDSLRVAPIRYAQNVWRHRLIATLNFFLSRKMLVRLALLIVVIALVMTRSRMGNSAFMLGLIVLGLACAWHFVQWRMSALILILSLVLIDVIVIGQWVGLERLMERIEQTHVERDALKMGESVEARVEPGRYTWEMIAERPWLGFGAGTYYTVFPAYKSESTRNYYDHAHNDYAELASEMGFIGIGFFGLIVFSSLYRAWQIMHARYSPVARSFGAAVLLIISALLLHSTVDFNLYLPANVLVLLAFLALLWVVPKKSVK